MNNSKENSITDKIRLSLVIKLNMRLFFRMLASFLALDIALCMLLFGVSIWKAESTMQSIITSPMRADIAIESYKIISIENTSKGINLPNFISVRLPIKSPDAVRSIKQPSVFDQMPILNKINLLEYNVELTVDGVLYRITYSIGEDLRLYLNLIFIIVIYELFILLSGIKKGARSIRKTLKPLSDMATTARNLNYEVSSKISTSDYSQIKDLAGAISGIDKLDGRISIDESQNELKDLAGAINNMLSRISEAYRSQVQFVSDASHELRTPISVIQGYANLLDRWGKNDEKTMQESIDAIKSESENMQELVEQLLFLARGDNETLKLHMQIFDVSEMACEIIRETEMINTSHNFKCIALACANINADKQLMKQAIRILIDNSIKYTSYGGEISIKVTTVDNFVHIAVQDNGIGIESEELSHIFDRFYRADISRTRKTGGSGLGLSIAKCIVDKQGGYLEVLSRKDIGTRITIVMPNAKPLE